MPNSNITYSLYDKRDLQFITVKHPTLDNAIEEAAGYINNHNIIIFRMRGIKIDCEINRYTRRPFNTAAVDVVLAQSQYLPTK